jgi:hypothetical protein
MFIEHYDQGQICGVFAPGQGWDVPTRCSFACFLPLVLLAGQMKIF